MPLLSLTGVAAEYGATRVFSGVDVALEPRQRLGIVGPNGAGKSTLLKLITGEQEPAEGRVERQRKSRIGMLAQFDQEFTEETVLEQALEARRDLLDMRHRLHELERGMSAGDHGKATIAAYGEVQERYDHGGGYTLEARAREILGGLGFLDEALEQPPAQLSGGWRRRLQLAQLLMHECEVYLLDEPTNHLDLASIEWLEEFLQAAPQAMIVVSHDRRFLDNVVDSILELEAGRGYSYPGNYTKFIKLRAARRREQQRQFEAQQEYIAHQEAFIQRYKAGQRAREARGRATRLERLERVEAPPDDKEMHIRFGGPPSAQVPLQSRGLVAGYEGAPLVRVPGFIVDAGSRIAIVGPNGSGKTTLLKTMEGSLRALEGSVAYGARVQKSYYDQHLGDLREDANLIEVLSEVHPVSEASARHHLARLLFRGDDVFKRVRALSGGERSRLALARLMLDQGNLLFLDEPTNHLDLPSQEVLQEALLEFPGTLIFVSHDRELIDRLATHTWWVEGTEVRIEAGGYRDHKKGPTSSPPPPSRMRGSAVSVDPPETPRPEPGAEEPKRAAHRLRAEAAAQRAARAARVKVVKKLEAEVGAAEARLKEIEARLADPEIYRFQMEAEILGKEHARVTSRITELYAEWEIAQRELESHEAAKPG